MKIQENKTLKLKLKGKNIDTFKSVLKKLNDSDKKVGFTQNPFNDDEKQLLKDMDSKV